MYFPYLFGRRFELLALRRVSAELPLNATIAPVIEPVKRDLGDLKRCLQILGAARVRTTVVMNPKLGDFERGGTGNLSAGLAEEFEQYPSLLPGFLCNQEIRAQMINQFLETYPDREATLLYWNPRLNETEITTLTRNRRIRFHIVLHEQIAAALRTILPRRSAVDIRDHFHHLPRNSDYAGSEFFSDSHLTYETNSVGFGDFMTIGSVYRKGGGPAHAVAIHAVFKQTQTNQIWVEHFISDDTELEIGTTPEKFLQAARKLVRAAARRRAEFGSNGALTEFANHVRNNYFPGLGVSKQLQIHHHIALNHQILTGGL